MGQGIFNRHGFGTLRKPLKNGEYSRIYIGHWQDNVKHGEGKQFYEDSTYLGLWENGLRHGIGILWHDNASVYIGEWKFDKFDGAGVLFESMFRL